MIILPQSVKVTWNINNKSHYLMLGYNFTSFKEEFYVNVLDLPRSSKTKVRCMCSYCGKEVYIQYKRANPKRKIIFPSEMNNVCGNRTPCFYRKIRDITLEKYGVKNVALLKAVNEKAKITCMKKYGEICPTKNQSIKEKVKLKNIEKYGVCNAFQSDVIKEKIRKTSLEKYGNKHAPSSPTIRKKIETTNLKRYGKKCTLHSELIGGKIRENNIKKYGVEYSLQRKDVLEKIRATNLLRYGVEYIYQSDAIKKKAEETNIIRYGFKHSFQSNLIREKAIKTILERYGVEKPFQSKSVRETAKRTVFKRYGVSNPFQINVSERIEKAKKTMYLNGTGPCSKQQKHLHSILGGELNFPVGKCLLDIAYPDKLIYIEYDGSGHGFMDKYYGSMESFNKKQIYRKAFLQNLGWKIIRYVTRNDTLMKDRALLLTIKKCIKYLIEKGHSWIEINIDDRKIKCSEYIRNIKKEDINETN